MAAVGGAFVGAWFGYDVTTGLIAVFTTIVGSAAGANLILLVLDSARPHGARNRHGDPAPGRHERRA